MVGGALLVAPVLTQGATSVTTRLPGATTTWYDVRSHAAHAGGQSVTVPAPMDTVPVFQRGGSIVPRQDRPRRSSALMVNDPYSLTIAPDATGTAHGQLFLDDGETFAYQAGAFRLRNFDYAMSGSTATLAASTAAGGKAFAPANTIERVTVLGVKSAPASATLTAHDGSITSVDTLYDAASSTLTLRKPDAKVSYDWTITIQW